MECNHWRNEIKIGPYTVVASSLLGYEEYKDRQGKMPDYGFYLDPGWTTCRMDYPHEMVNWPDKGTIELSVFASLVESIIVQLKSGRKVDIACVEGHGRTGTLLAALAIKIEHLSAADAIKAVRDRYCSEAVESAPQRQLLADYEKMVLRQPYH